MWFRKKEHALKKSWIRNENGGLLYHDNWMASTFKEETFVIKADQASLHSFLELRKLRPHLQSECQLSGLYILG